MPIKTISICDPKTGSTASIAPQLGFNCFSFAPMIGGQSVEVLWHDPQFREGNTRPSRSGIPILFPFAGRIRGGKFRYRGRDYQLEANDGLGNAIHGFVYTRPWRVLSQQESMLSGEFQASIDDPAILDRWPADFRIHATYAVSGQQLTATYEITNTGDEPLPWWLGAHPYFRLSLGGGSPADAVVQFAVEEEWKLADLLPTGKVRGVPEAESCARGAIIGDRQFDNVYSIDVRTSEWQGSVTDQAAGIATAIRFGQPFGKCVVFIPPHREAICLEPYTGLPNAFELLEHGIEAGLHELEPGESREMTFSIGVRGVPAQ